MWRGLVARFGEPPTSFPGHIAFLIRRLPEGNMPWERGWANHIKKSLVFFYSFPKLARLKQVILLDREFIQDSENIYFC